MMFKVILIEKVNINSQFCENFINFRMVSLSFEEIFSTIKTICIDEKRHKSEKTKCNDYFRY